MLVWPNQSLGLTAEPSATDRSGSWITLQMFTVVPQNAIDIELCLRITNGKSRRDPPKESFGAVGLALANWIGEDETEVG